MCAAAVCQVGIKLERARDELAARQAARMQRLYNQGTPSATAAAQQSPVSPGAQHPVPVKPQPRSPACTALSSTTHHPSLAYPPPTSPACDAPASLLQKTMLQPPPPEPTSPGVPAQQQQGAARLEGQAAEGAGRQGGGPLVPAEEQDAEWESVQREHEDANMGLFQRILPSDDPEQQVGGCLHAVGMDFAGGQDTASRSPAGWELCSRPATLWVWCSKASWARCPPCHRWPNQHRPGTAPARC